MRERFSETQILEFLRLAAAGTPVMELCWNHCFSRSTFRAWKARYGGAIADGARQLEELEHENARLRKALAQRAGGASTNGTHGNLSKAATRARKRANSASASI